MEEVREFVSELSLEEAVQTCAEEGVVVGPGCKAGPVECTFQTGTWDFAMHQISTVNPVCC